MGQKFGKLTAVERTESFDKNNGFLWKCLCDCGNETYVPVGRLRSGGAKSCGCSRIEKLKEVNKRHCASKTRLYNIWCLMRSRCEKEYRPFYKRYGGRGITVCEEWQTFEGFRDWAVWNGYADNLSIDRINNDGNYEPNNCRWATSTQQTRNTSQSISVEYQGKKYALADLANKKGLSYMCLYKRIKKGMTVEEAVEKPIKGN